MTKLFAFAGPAHVAATNVLVIALDAAGPLDLTGRHVLVVAPALNSRLRHWMSDDGEARRAAEERLEATVDGLERAASTRAGTSATPIPCRRSPTPCRPSRPTRS